MSSPSWDYIAKLVCIGDSGCGKSSLTIRLCEGRFVAHHDVTIGVEFGSRIVPVGPPAQKDDNALSSSQLPPASSTLNGDASNTELNSKSSKSLISKTNTTTTTSDSTSSTKKTYSSLPDPPRVPPSPADQKHMKLSLWDTAGQETYKSVTRSYFRGASGALLVFDLTRRSTFQHVTDWLADLRQIAEPDIVVVLVGNKADLTASAGSSSDGDAGAGGATNHEESDPAAAESTSTENKRDVTRREAEDWARRNGVLEYVETSAKSGEGVERAFTRVAERIYQNIQAGKYDLNDRRSGVKGANAGGPSAGGRQVRLTNGAKGGTVGGGCC